MKDYFAVLGLGPRASDREIRDAYRRLAKSYHPDSTNSADGERLMQELNEAKAILFDPVKREEYRVMLGLRDTVTRERLEALRNDPRFTVVSTYRPKQDQRPRSVWDIRWKKYFVGLVSSAVLLVAGVSIYELVTAKAPQHSIESIIERYKRIQPMYVDTSKLAADTMAIPDDTAPHLKRKADIFFQLGEYRSASKYYEKYLTKAQPDDTLLRNLSFAYFHRGRYAEALQVLSRQMQGDSNLVVAYYNIGEMFLADEKPFDARDAFAESVRIADSMRRSGRTPPNYERWARSELAKLE
jgi:tetratricopeptide (TPR) repeat protein